MKRTRHSLPFALALSALCAGAARAQVPVSTNTAVDVGSYRPMTPANRGFQLESPRVLPHKAWALALDLDYASNPLRVRANPGGEFRLLEQSLGANLLAAIGLWNRIDVALALPVVLSQDGTAPPGIPAPPGGGLGDARFTVKARILGPEPRGFSLATSLTLSAPLGRAGLINDGGLGIEPRLIGEYQVRRWTAGARLGYRMRPSHDLLGTDVGDQLTFGFGGQMRIGRVTRALAEIAGAMPAGGDAFKKRLTPMEAMVGVRRHWRHLFATAGVGVGLVSGFGSPAARGVLSIGWATVGPDSDRDGVEDFDDQCQDEPEDRDDFQDADGCPDPDNDEDGIADGDDNCPLEPEDGDEFEDEDGCPDPDNDKDGIADESDKCPNEAETKNEWEDEDGCPDEVPNGDEDKDGIRDVDDACPKDAEDKDGFEDEDGCPDLDNDKDGVPDQADKCPAESETINGNKDDDGCPDEGAPQVKVGTNEIETIQPVFFNTDRSRVKRRFQKILNQVALTLNAHSEIGRCAVEGHTDSIGPAEWNQTLSKKRAEAVVGYLVKQGVAADRLFAIGQGESKPWAENDSEEGRAKNRRVVFHIEGIDTTHKPRPRRLRRSERSEEPTAEGREHGRARTGSGKSDGTSASGDGAATKDDSPAAKGDGRPTKGEKPAAKDDDPAPTKGSGRKTGGSADQAGKEPSRAASRTRDAGGSKSVERKGDGSVVAGRGGKAERRAPVTDSGGSAPGEGPKPRAGRREKAPETGGATTMNDGNNEPDRGSVETAATDTPTDRRRRTRVALPAERNKRIGPANEDELEGKSLRDLIQIPK